MIDLERSLVELAERVEIPGGQWLVDDVVRRIGEPVPHRPARRGLVLAAALAALVTVAIAVLPGPRHVVARWLGFDSVHIEPGVTVPTTTVEPGLDLGPSLSIAAAMSRTGLPDATPALLGAPQSVHVVHPPDSGQIILVYAPSDLLPLSSVTGVGALVSVLPAHIQEGYFQKALGADATMRSVAVAGADAGYWIEGAPHQLFFQSGDKFEVDALRLATNTLVWQRGDHVYRLEADISLQTALRIATSIP